MKLCGWLISRLNGRRRYETVDDGRSLDRITKGVGYLLKRFGWKVKGDEDQPDIPGIWVLHFGPALWTGLFKLENCLRCASGRVCNLVTHAYRVLLYLVLGSCADFPCVLHSVACFMLVGSKSLT